MPERSSNVSPNNHSACFQPGSRICHIYNQCQESSGLDLVYSLFISFLFSWATYESLVSAFPKIDTYTSPIIVSSSSDEDNCA